MKKFQDVYILFRHMPESVKVVMGPLPTPCCHGISLEGQYVGKVNLIFTVNLPIVAVDVVLGLVEFHVNLGRTLRKGKAQ